MVKILLSHIQIHKDKMAHAPAHHEQMKNLVGTEIFVLRVKDGQFQRVDHTAHRVENASRQKPQKGAC